MTKPDPMDLQGWAICIDERCHQEGLHPPHAIVDTEADVRWRGWRDDPLEQAPPARASKPRGLDALDQLILEAVQWLEVRTFAQLGGDIANTYGSCCPRRLHRRLARLVLTGHVAAVDPGGLRQLRVYVRAGSPLAMRPDEIFDQVECAQAMGA